MSVDGFRRGWGCSLGGVFTPRPKGTLQAICHVEWKRYTGVGEVGITRRQIARRVLVPEGKGVIPYPIAGANFGSPYYFLVKG